METRDPKKALLTAMDEVIDSVGLRSLRFAEVGAPPSPRACSQNYNRLNVLLEGFSRQYFVSGGKETAVESLPGDGVFYPPYGWYRYVGTEWRRAFSLVFRDGQVRFVHKEARGEGKGRNLEVFHSYQIQRPLAAPGRQVLAALRHVALKRGDVETGRHLGVALLRVCREELIADAGDDVEASERTFQTAVAFLQDHFHEAINREETARVLNLSPSYLSRLFKERTGETFIHYLWRLRLDRAVELLATGAWTVAEVAAKCGFGDLAHFHRTFKKVHGKTPASFQRER